MNFWIKLLTYLRFLFFKKKLSFSKKIRFGKDRIIQKNMDTIVDRLSKEMTNAENFIDNKREQFYEEISQNVYEFNYDLDPFRHYYPKEDEKCRCTYVVQQTPDDLNRAIFDQGSPNLYANIELIPYTVCYECKQKLKKQARPISVVIKALKEGRLQVHVADTLKLKIEKKMLQLEEEDKDE